MRIAFKILKRIPGGKDWHPGCKKLNSERNKVETARRITKVTAPGVCIDNSLGILKTNPE
jgi:hypothetical protein